MGDRLVFIATVLAVFLLLSTLMYGAVRLAGWVFFGPRKKPYEPARQRIDRRGPRGPLRPPSKPPEWQARHARPRRVAPHPDVPAPRALEVPRRPDRPPVHDADTAELVVINPDLENAA